MSLKDRNHYDFLVVGAGFAGAVMAERLAAATGKQILVIDKRDHVGGNAFDEFNDHGILVHKYGPHIFHTNSQEVYSYLSRFTGWRSYEHRVLAHVDNKLVPIPINRDTLNSIFETNLKDDFEASEFLLSRVEKITDVRTSEDVCLAAVGRELYEKFFRGYTVKQWGVDPSCLDKAVTARIPTRTNTDNRYFTDKFQVMPDLGYTKMFEKMLSHANIDLLLKTSFRALPDTITFDHLIYTGPIDEYFNFELGRLPYRSIHFEHKTIDRERHQAAATTNYPSLSVPFTRITEFKLLTGQTHPKTSIVFEFPSSTGDPYYPIPQAQNKALFRQYETLGLSEQNVTFVGRLASYQYYNMDQVVAQALMIHRKFFAGTSPKHPRPASSEIELM